jgi:hypothetical protein
MDKRLSAIMAIVLILAAAVAFYLFDGEFEGVIATLRSIWMDLPSPSEVKLPMPKWPF